MARDDDEKEDNKAQAKIEKSLKTTRTLFVSVLVAMFVIISISVTSVVVINVQLAARNEVPAADFAEDLALLESQLEHITAIHNSEAKVYFEFQDTLAKVEALYHQDSINELRRMMVERESDQRKLLDLMAEGRANLADMLAGERDWTQAYTKKIEAAKQLSIAREKAIKEAMVVKDSKDDATKKTAAELQKAAKK